MSQYPPLHVSGIQTFFGCRRKWFYSDRNWGLGYTSPYLNDKVLVGIWVHYALALVNQGASYADAFAQTVQRHLTVYGESPEVEQALKLEGLLQAHELWQKHDNSWYSDIHLDWLQVEQPFSFSFQGYTFEGILDGVVQHKETGELLVFERKTTSKPETITYGVQWDLQPRLYLMAAEEVLGRPPVGMLYEVIRNCNPMTVKLLKSGLPSKAKVELDGTTFEVYNHTLMQAIDDLGLNKGEVLAEYQPQFDHLRTNNNPIFRRTIHSITAGARASGLRIALAAGKEMAAAALQGTEVIPTGLNRHSCGYCPYKDVCLAKDDGADWKELLEMTFVKNAERFDADYGGK